MFFILIGVWGAAAAVAAKRNPSVSSTMLLASFLLVPAVASESLLGGIGRFTSVSTLVVVVFLLLRFVLDSGAILRSLKAIGFAFWPLLFSVMGMFWWTAQSADGNNNVIVTQVVAPLLLFVALGSIILSTPQQRVRQISLGVVWIGLTNSLVACAVALGALGQPFANSLLNQYWYSVGFTRALGLTDHPLVLSSLLVSSICLVGAIRKIVVQWSVLAILVIGLALTASRGGLGLAAVAVSALLFSKATERRQRVLLAVGVIAGLAFFSRDLLALGLLDRLSDDDGSSQARRVAWEAFVRSADGFAFSGGGSGFNGAFAASLGLKTSLESAPLMYVVDFGFPVAVTYFGTLCYLIYRGARASGAHSLAWVAASLCLVSTVSFSSLSVLSGMGGLLWSLVALAYFGRPLHTDARGYRMHRAGARKVAP